MMKYNKEPLGNIYNLAPKTQNEEKGRGVTKKKKKLCLNVQNRGSEEGGGGEVREYTIDEASTRPALAAANKYRFQSKKQSEVRKINEGPGCVDAGGLSSRTS